LTVVVDAAIATSRPAAMAAPLSHRQASRQIAEQLGVGVAAFLNDQRTGAAG
jgi:hypothetical protein